MKDFHLQISKLPSCLLHSPEGIPEWLDACKELAFALNLHAPVNADANPNAPRVLLPAVFTTMSMAGLSPSLKTIWDIKLAVMLPADVREPFTLRTFTEFLYTVFIPEGPARSAIMAEFYAARTGKSFSLASFVRFRKIITMIGNFGDGGLPDEAILEHITKTYVREEQYLFGAWAAAPPANLDAAMLALLNRAIMPNHQPDDKPVGSGFFVKPQASSQRGRGRGKPMSARPDKPPRSDKPQPRQPTRQSASDTPEHRYQPSSSEITCHNCGGKNHLSADCLAIRAPPRSRSHAAAHAAVCDDSDVKSVSFSPASIPHHLSGSLDKPAKMTNETFDSLPVEDITEEIVPSLNSFCWSTSKSQPCAQHAQYVSCRMTASPIDDKLGEIVATTTAYILQQLTPSDSSPSESKDWIMDSGCTELISGNPDLFCDMSQSTTIGHVKIANDYRTKVAGTGTVEMIFESCTITVSGVLFVPEIKINLFSPQALFRHHKGFLHLDSVTDKSFIQIGSHKITLHQRANSQLWFLPPSLSKYYVAPLISPHASAFNGDAVETTHKQKKKMSGEEFIAWHERLAHIGFSQLAQMLRRLGISIPAKVQNLVCKLCLLNKATRQPVAQNTETTIPFTKTGTPGAVTMLDIVGKFEIPGYENSVFAFAFVDSATSFRVWYPSKTKEAAPEIVLEMTRDATTHPRHLAGAFPFRTGWFSEGLLHTDNDSVFRSEDMKKVLAAKSIRLQCAPPYSPTANAVAERSNRVILDKMRTLLSPHLAPSLWPLAMQHAVLLTNLSPCSTNDNNKSPFEAATGLSPLPLLDRMRIFGSTVYVTIDSDTRTGKLSPKARVGIYVGFDTTNGAHMIKMTDTQRIISSIHVRFDEPINSSRPVRSLTSALKTPDVPPTNKTTNSGSDTESKATKMSIPPTSTSIFATPKLSNVPSVSSAQVIHQSASNQSDPNPPLAATASPDFDLTVPPTSVKNARDPRRPDVLEWKASITDEYTSLCDNKTYTRIARSSIPQGTNILRSKFVFKLKPQANNTIKHKSRVVACGYTQIPDIDFNPSEIFAPVLRYTSFRMILALACHENDEIRSVDVKTAFLNGSLNPDDGPIYMFPPEQECNERGEEMVWLLHRSIYGLKQSPRIWHETDAAFLTGEMGLVQCKSDPCVFVNAPGTPRLKLGLWVDDHFISGKTSTIDAAIAKMGARFTITDLGAINLALGMRIHRNYALRTLLLSSEDFVMNLLLKHNMEKCNPALTPLPPNTIVWQEFPRPLPSRTDRQRNDEPITPSPPAQATNDPKLDYRGLIGALLHLANTTRPDIAAAVAMMSRYMTSYTLSHFNLAKHILRYLRGTIHHGITFGSSQHQPLPDPIASVTQSSPTQAHAFSDADWATCPDDRISITGLAVMLNNGAISWRSKKQPTPALSSSEAEFQALSICASDVLHIRGLLFELGYPQLSTIIFEDNQSAIHLAHNAAISDRTKHIDTRYHFIRHHVNSRALKIVHAPTSLQVADVLTKNLPVPKFQLFAACLLNKPFPNSVSPF